MISVVIPCYNHGPFLDECVDSVLNQTFKDFEIIVVDDGSTDGVTPDIAKRQEKKSSKIKTFAHSTNQFIAAARNTGVKNASGELIVNSDADCYFHPTILEKYYEAITSKKGDIIYCTYLNFGDNIRSTNSNNPEYSFQRLCKSNIITVAAMYYKKHWEEVGGYNEDLKFGAEDWEFWINMGERGHFGYLIPEILFYYRHHKDRVTTNIMNPNMDKVINQIRRLHCTLKIG